MLSGPGTKWIRNLFEITQNEINWLQSFKLTKLIFKQITDRLENFRSCFCQNFNQLFRV